MILEATHTHLYPGNCGRVSGLAQMTDLQTGGDCLIEFADGSAASARISKSENGWHLHTNAYRTAAGTSIAEKLWCVSFEEDGENVGFRVLEKAQGK